MNPNPTRANQSRDREGAVVPNPTHDLSRPAVDCDGAGNSASACNAGHMDEQILRRGAPQDDIPPETPPSLSPEQFRRMLAETLAADPNLARRLLGPLVGTAFPIQGAACLTNYLAKFTAASCTSLDSSTVYDDGGNVGIGKTPDGAAKLDVAGNVRAQGSNPRFILESSDANTARRNIDLDGTGSGAKWRLYKEAKGTDPTQEYLTILSDGKVGIGTSNPAEKLDVAGNILSQGLNKIVFLKPSGGDNRQQIQDAIDQLRRSKDLVTAQVCQAGQDVRVVVTACRH